MKQALCNSKLFLNSLIDVSLYVMVHSLYFKSVLTVSAITTFKLSRIYCFTIKPSILIKGCACLPTKISYVMH